MKPNQKSYFKIKSKIQESAETIVPSDGEIEDKDVAALTQTAGDAGDSTPSSANADALPGELPDGASADDAQTLGESRQDAFTLQPGFLVKVFDAKKKPIDSGIVTKVFKGTVHLEGNVSYDGKTHSFMRLG